VTQPHGSKVTLDSRGLTIDGQFRPLAAGEFEYWRHHSLYWRKILDTMKASGLEFVATFVCWDFHELTPGDFDFVGRTYPSRDLAGFIDACSDAGLQVLIRVGPIMDAEWPTRGPAPDVTPLERLHPDYLRRTREYLKALAPVLIPRLATRGGPVALVSIDNEAYFPYSTDIASDPSAGSIHVPYDAALVRSLYRGWLRERYQDSGQLASAWGQSGVSLDTAEEPIYASASLTETLDSFDFITASLKRSFSLQREMCDEIGIDVPIYTNMKQFTHYIDWREIESVVASHGLNLHMPNLWPGDQRLVASWYCRLLRALVRFPWAPEFQGATSIGLDDIFGILSPDQGRFTSLMAMALGLRGLCYYVFVERDDSHYAPISPIGKVRPQLAGFEQAIAVLKELRADKHCSEVGLLWSQDHHRCLVASRFPNWRNLYDIWIQMDEPKELGPWWDVFRDLHDSDVDFDIVPVDRELGDYKALIYAGPEFLRTEELERLGKWVEAGGKLVCTTTVPSRSLDSPASDLSPLAGTIGASGNLIYRPWGRIKSTLDGIGVESIIQSEVPGLWTFAYREESTFSLFVANVGSDPQLGQVKLGSRDGNRIIGRRARDITADQEWEVTSTQLWSEPPLLAPNEVRCIRIPIRS
jgi:hypothetical protein